MSSYLKSEFYRILHNKWTYLFIAICSALLLSSNVLLAIVKSHDSGFTYATTGFAFDNAGSNLLLIYLLCIMVSSMIFGNEYVNHTMKNTISYGIPRGMIYFGKLFVQFIYAIAALCIIMAVDIGSAYLLLEISGTASLEELLRALFACLPFFLFGLATMNCFVFILETANSAVAAASGIMIALPLVFNLLGMKFEMIKSISEIFPLNIISSTKYDVINKQVIYYWSSSEGLNNCWIYGIIQMAVILLAGYFLFRRKEIK